MRFFNAFVSLVKRLFVLILILSIIVPLKYGSTNPIYLTLRLIHSVLTLKHSILSDQARPTLSAEYRAFENMIRMKSLIKYDVSTDPAIRLKNFRSITVMGNIIPRPSQCQVNREVVEHDGHSVDSYWIDFPARKFQKDSAKLLLYIHGGGYISGDIHSHSGFECHLSQLFNFTILHVEYRLTPEHPLPAAVDDTVAIYRALLRQNIAPSQILIMGDSAGGGLALLTVQALLARQIPVPHGIIALSPWTDLSISGDSYTRNRPTDIIFTSDDIEWLVDVLMGVNRSELLLNNPLWNSLFGSFEEFPPMYINVGTAEVFEDDSRRIVEKAQEAGVNVKFEEGLHLVHCYPIFFHYFPEARNTLDNINKWIQTIVHAN